MTKWRVVIADDEPLARRGVHQLLAGFPEFDVVGEARDGRELLEAIVALEPHVVFVDVAMPEVDGLTAARQRGSSHWPLVVFLTAYDEFAVAAFDVDAVDYLVKPVGDERFGQAVKRLTSRLDQGPRGSAQTCLSVPTPRGTVLLPLDAVDWIEAEDYYVRVWTGGRSHLLRDSLQRLERQVSSHGFVRAHRGAIVRIGAVSALHTATDKLVLVLTSGARVPVSRRRRAELLKALQARSAGPLSARQHRR